jgi:Fe-S cluster assembly protein SufD
MFARFSGARSKGALRGVSLLRHRTHADTTLFVDHVGEGCESRETFRTILDGEATGVFQGKIRVAPSAQKTDGKMMSRALLLSENAAMNNKPELEIFADDVACGHGATCGGLSEEHIFYLCSRGLPRRDAEALLLEAFAAELVDDIGEPALVARLRGAITEWLGSRART